jgi:NADH:ubiquinone oxidoreductase subunit E
MRKIDLEAMAADELHDRQQYRCRVMACSSTACLASGAAASRQALEEGVKKAQA